MIKYIMFAALFLIVACSQQEEIVEQQHANLAVIDPVDIAAHNTEDDCWIGYQGKVYDITDWLPRHPGTAEKILPFCGTGLEFEQAFSGQHGSSKVQRLEQEGVLIGNIGG